MTLLVILTVTAVNRRFIVIAIIITILNLSCWSWVLFLLRTLCYWNTTLCVSDISIRRAKKLLDFVDEILRYRNSIYIYIRSQVVQVLKCKDELLHTQDREFHQHPHPTVQCPAAHPHVPSGCQGVSDDTSMPTPQASWVDCLSHLWSLERQINGEYVTRLGVQYTSSWQVTNSLEFLMPYLSSASKISGRSLIAFFNLGGGNVTGITMSNTTSDLTTNISTIRTYRSKKLRFHFFNSSTASCSFVFSFFPFFEAILPVFVSTNVAPSKDCNPWPSCLANMDFISGFRTRPPTLKLVSALWPWITSSEISFSTLYIRAFLHVGACGCGVPACPARPAGESGILVEHLGGPSY